MRVFVVGFPKSGTSTLQDAFTRSGLKSAHWYSRLVDRYVGRSMYQNLYAGNDPLLDFRDFDAITQADLQGPTVSFWPQLDPVMMAAVRAHHPDCVFVLNYRDPGATVDSMLRWGDFHDRLIKGGAPGLPAGMARQRKNVVTWMEMQIDALRRAHGGDDRFFEYDITDVDAPRKLSARLGVEIRWWGRSNDNRDGSALVRRVT
jgi:hypothetical protein